MRSKRLEKLEMERKATKRLTRESSLALQECHEEEKKDTVKNALHTEWYSRRRAVTVAVTLQRVEGGAEECPILMEPFESCRMEFNPDLQYGMKNEKGEAVVYNKVTIDSCSHSFFPLALVMHWMLHGMRCPLCKSGCDEKLCSSCLPLSVSTKLSRHARKIRNEMDSEVFESDLRLVESLGGEDEIEILGSFSGEHFPLAVMLDVIPLQNWDIINECMRLSVTLHYDVDSMPQDQVLSALNSQGGMNPWRLERLSEPTGTYTVQGSLSLCEDTLMIEDPTFGYMNVPRSQCRWLSRMNQLTRPSWISCTLDYFDHSVTLQVCKMQPMPGRCQHESLFTSNSLVMDSNGSEAVVGYLETQWMTQHLCDSSSFGYGIYYQRVIVDKRAFISRVTQTKIILYMMENEMLQNDSQMF